MVALGVGLILNRKLNSEFETCYSVKIKSVSFPVRHAHQYACLNVYRNQTELQKVITPFANNTKWKDANDGVTELNRNMLNCQVGPNYPVLDPLQLIYWSLFLREAIRII